MFSKKIIQFILISIILFFTITTVSASSDDTWTVDDEQFTHRKPIYIETNQTLNDYQINYNVTYYDNMQSDFGDVRFVYNDTILPYYIEEKNNGESANTWFNVSMSSGNNTVWMYYGNPNLTSQSNKSDTFISYLDDGSNWQKNDPNNRFDINDGKLEFNDLTRNEKAYVYQENNKIADKDLKITYENKVTKDDWKSFYMSGALSSDYGTRGNLGSEYFYKGTWTYGMNMVLFTSDGNDGNNYGSRNKVYKNELIKSGNEYNLNIYDSNNNLVHNGHTTANINGSKFKYVTLIASYDSNNQRHTSGWIDDFKICTHVSDEPEITTGTPESKSVLESDYEISNIQNYFIDSNNDIYINTSIPSNHHQILYAKKEHGFESTNSIFSTFEDMENQDLSYWNGDTNRLSIDQDNSLSGNYSAKLHSDGDKPVVSMNITTPEVMKFKTMADVDDSNYDTDEANRMMLYDVNNNLVTGIQFSDTIMYNGMRVFYDGGYATTIRGWSDNTIYDVKIELDYENNQATYYINDVNEGTYSFNTKTNNISKMKWIVHRDSSLTSNAWLDDLIIKSEKPKVDNLIRYENNYYKINITNLESSETDSPIKIDGSKLDIKSTKESWKIGTELIKTTSNKVNIGTTEKSILTSNLLVTTKQP